MSCSRKRLTGPWEGKRLAHDGGSIHYHDVGSGPPLLMLQAFGPLPGTTAWFTFAHVLEEFSAGFRCILLDNPNFGLSSAVTFAEPVHDMYVRQALAVLDAEGIDRTSVVGVSTGGTVALDLAIAAPERVDRLVVGSCEFSTGGEPYLLSAFPSEVARLFDENVRGMPHRGRLRRLLRALVHDDALVDEHLVDAFHEWRVAEPEHAAAWSASHNVPAARAHSVGGVEAPTLIIHGRQDRMVPVEQALRLLTLLPAATLTVLNACGHWPTRERPRDYAAHALEWLTRTG